MKLTKEALKDIILEEMQSIVAEEEQETGSWYKSSAGKLFDQRLGVQGLMDELEEARDPILKIQRVAEECRNEAADVDDRENYEYFDKMLKICDNLLETMQYNVFLQFELRE